MSYHFKELAKEMHGASPGMFLSISMILVKVMYPKGHVAIFIQAITGLQVQFVSFLFVDDRDLFVMACYLEESSDSITAHTQEGSLTWHGALDVSGGALKQEKCYWSLVDFRWINGMWRYVTSQEAPTSISIPNANGNVMEIK